MKKNNWGSFLSLAALPLLQLLLGAVLLLNPDGALAVIFRIIGWLLVAVALVLAISLAMDRVRSPGRVIGAVICGICGALLLRNPLILAASTGKILGLLLILRALAGMVQGGKFSGTPGRHALGELPELIIGAFLLLSPMTPTRLIFGVVGVVLIIGAVAKLLGIRKEVGGKAELKDPKIIDADE